MILQIIASLVQTSEFEIMKISVWKREMNVQILRGNWTEIRELIREIIYAERIEMSTAQNGLKLYDHNLWNRETLSKEVVLFYIIPTSPLQSSLWPKYFQGHIPILDV